jgi:uncharacterized membrane protein
MKQSIASLLIFSLLLTACATTTPKNAQTKPANIKEWLATQSRPKSHAIAGAFAGAVLGAVSARLSGGDPWQGAAAGAIIGATVGFNIGKRQDRIYAQRDLAVRQAQYERSQGYVASIEEVGFNPAKPKPGQKATLYVRYMIIGPDPDEKISVKMFRGLKYGEDYIMGAGPNEFDVPRGGGIVESTMDVTLPEKTPQGTYSVEALIEDPKGRFPMVISTGAVYVVASLGNTPRREVVVASR